MYRGSPEYTDTLALLLLDLEPRGLNDDAEALHEEDTAQDRQQQFLVDDHGTDTNDAADGQGTCVSHEDLGREGVIPQETDHCSDESAEEYHQLLGMGDIHDIEIGREADV